MKKISATRESVTHKAVIRCAPEACEKCGHVADGSGRVKFFFTVGIIDGKPVELFLHMDRSGSTIDGFAKCWALAVSLCLREGVPLEKVVEKFSFQQFEPRGFTENAQIRTAQSVVDYVARWLAREFLDNAVNHRPEEREVV